MVKTAQYGPDSPREWDPNHPSLSAAAPHETAAVMRMSRAGRPGSEIMKTLRLRGTRLMSMLQKAMDDESRAFERGVPIYDALIKSKKED